MPKGKQIQRIAIQENIVNGQRVKAFEVLGFQNGKWKMIVSGSSVGHKFITSVPKATYKK
ncbi:hypothetical protein [Niabella ginsengisoli]|uniref:Uncharacterized protein n=1 Tax=Niabella ginsengisoli TaxID=522298 RepID=A0ABS9SFC3_9BACT|nr:hypothetical protein [Niabella ginsengisoli]MCH5597021.1 hypothetical protein [Niabella ginsengisoli]